MGLSNLVYIIIVGVIVGFLAGLFMKGKGFGFVVNLIVGIVGAFIGDWLFGFLGINLESGFIGTLITAFIGAVILLFTLNLVAPKKTRKRRK